MLGERNYIGLTDEQIQRCLWIWRSLRGTRKDELDVSEAARQRAELGFRRPLVPPDVHLDEAETSIHASFLKKLSRRDREDRVEDARDRIFDWLALPKE